MNQIKIIAAFFFLLFSSSSSAQLGFCTGSKGEPIFTENFGNGTNYGPALPTGTTNYNFVTGSPNDGSYTLFYRTNLYSTWHYSLDHTPDATNGVNGKALIVNANASTTGDFYKRIVTGLCVNTTFEFSAWVMNVYNPGSGFCGASEIPINVRFEIWNDTETVLLGSGDTGNIMGTFSPIWQQFALVFTTGAETSVVLKMKNNGVGGCGNDLAIDDIEFRACGELTTISSPPLSGQLYQACSNQAPFSLTFQAATTGVLPHFYQWQSSSDGITWTDIPGANAAGYTATNISSTTYFRTKAAQDVANLNNSFCSTISDIFTVSFLNSPAAPISNGNVEICQNDPFPPLSVSANTTSGVNWYDALTGGNLLQSNTTSFTPAAAGTFYTETYDLNSNCLSTTRTPVTLSIVPLPTATISGITSICAGNSTVINFNGTPNAEITYTIDGGADQFITLDATGFATLTSPVLSANSTYSLVSITSPISASCNQTIAGSVTILVNPPPTASISGDTSLCLGDNGSIQFVGTPNATVFYTIDNGPSQFTVLNAIGEKTVAISNVTTTTVVRITEVSTAGGSGCSQTLSQLITFTVVPLPIATISANQTAVCDGDTVVLTFTGTPNSQLTYTENNGVNQTIDLNGSGTATLTTQAITTATTFRLVKAELLQSPFCFQSISDAVTIAINPIPTATFTGGIAYCSGETTAISLAADLVGTVFTWTVAQNGTTGATAGSGDQISQLLLATNANSTATYTVTPVYNNCTGNPMTIIVVVNAIPEPTLTDGAICLLTGNTSAQPYVLDTGLSTSDYSFEWYYEEDLISNANGSTYDAFQIGEYAVVATNLISGCVSPVVTAVVTESVLGESLVIEQSEAFSENPTITVTVVGGEGPFYYQLDDFGFQTSNVFTNVAPGFHTITVVDDSLCTNLTGTVTIINYPKFFTPNGDGYNDTWNITGVDGSSLIYIFDRYGKLLKQISPLGSGWDGTYNGQPVFSSDYWFMINYPENGTPKTFQSHFSLKR
ncbi:T9SS type B sorting domain-containing protein [Flavobacterium lacus]|uniref:Gliding motility-associated-like protein n=1 Tax=Flavobacterium lacus TaxID=1353778 RepID=A0A328WNF5_9FLAO|nr:T9SS type B sorting domain-containing protein [Flavobacterium lacus]RAR46666.1 gliding motility-associated-like protein [Flavobacterium lacus]